MKKLIAILAIAVVSLSTLKAQQFQRPQQQGQLIIHVDSVQIQGVNINVINVSGFQIQGNTVKVQSVATYKGTAAANGSLTKVVTFNLPDTTTLKYSNATALRLLSTATASVYGLHISN